MNRIHLNCWSVVRRLLFGFGMAVLWVNATADGVFDLYIDRHGAAGGDGGKSSPLQSFEASQAAVRRILLEHRAEDPDIRVHVGEGVYSLGRPLTFGELDSGGRQGRVTYKALAGHSVTLSGAFGLGSVAQAQRLGPADSGYEFEDQGAIRKIDLPEEVASPLPKLDLARHPGSKTEKTGPMELIVGGKVQNLVRWPNSSWAAVLQAQSEAAPNLVRGRDQSTFSEFTADIGKASRWKGKSLWIRGYFNRDWYDETIAAEVVSTNPVRFRLASAPVYGVSAKGRFVVLNEPAELDRDGEYYVDYATRTVYFRPRAEDADKDIAISIAQRPLVEFERASNISLEGLRIDGGRSHGITIVGGANVTISGCIVVNMGNIGISIKGGSGHSVSNSIIEDIGTTGIAVSGGDRRNLTESEHILERNRISRVGRRVASGHPGIYLSGAGIRVRYNSISQLPYAAIVFPGNNHLIEYNEISDVCAEQSDCGAVYLGRDWTSQGSVVRNNYIHDLAGPFGDASTMAVYLDDLSSNVTVSANVIANVFRGVLVGGGRDNIVSNNYFEQVKIPVSIDSRGLHWGARFLKPGGVLLTRLQAMPYRVAPWSERYPRLVNILQDQPGVPKRNTIQRNYSLNSGAMAIDPIARLAGKISENEDETMASLDGDSAKVRAVAAGPRIRQSIPAWNDLRVD